jgi:glycosyltransferase involved in cell wall biosynthesis
MRALKILMVTPRFEPSIGGVETHVRETSARLAARGHAVTVIAADADHDLAAEERARGVSIRRVRTWPRRRDLMAAPGLPRAMAAVDADVVHVQSYNTMVAPVALAVAAWLRRPAVLTFHSGGHSARLRQAIRQLQLLGLRPLIRQAAALVAVSGFEADLLATRLRLRRSRFSVIPNGADLPLPAAPPGEDRDLVLSLGRLEAYKGHDDAIRAVATLRSSRPGIHLQIVGRGPDEARLRRLAEATGTRDAVAFRHVPPDDRPAMAELLSTAGAVAVLSDFESQGIAASEAAAVGARVLVRDETALSELVRAGWATGVEPDAEAGAIAAALDRLLSTPRPAPRPVPTWDAAAEQLERLYVAVATSRRR